MRRLFLRTQHCHRTALPSRQPSKAIADAQTALLSKDGSVTLVVTDSTDSTDAHALELGLTQAVSMLLSKSFNHCHDCATALNVLGRWNDIHGRHVKQYHQLSNLFEVAELW
eukprot:2322339-Rhodomonas_salina.1